jgi:hypothetical protein
MQPRVKSSSADPQQSGAVHALITTSAYCPAALAVPHPAVASYVAADIVRTSLRMLVASQYSALRLLLDSIVLPANEGCSWWARNEDPAHCDEMQPARWTTCFAVDHPDTALWMSPDARRPTLLNGPCALHCTYVKQLDFVRAA